MSQTVALTRTALRGILAALALSAAVCPAQPIDLTRGKQAHWKFDETAGLTANDSGANANHGALVNFPDEQSHWIKGRVGGALAFNGSDYVEVPDHASIGSDLTNGFSVAAWFRSNVTLPATGGTRTSRMLEKGDAFFFLQNPGTGGMNFLVKKNNANFTASSGMTIESNQWYHIAGTFDGSVIRVYLNGELKGTNAVAGPLDDDHLPLRIGSDDAGAFFNGDMDDVQIWNRPLTALEIEQLSGKVVSGPPVITQQPGSQTVFAGATAEFNVKADGAPPLNFQWQKDGANLSGQTTNRLVLSDVTAASAGQYTVVIQNAQGSVTSAAAVLTVKPADLNAGKLAHWKFDETTGATAADASGNNRTGQLTDFPDPNAAWTKGQVNGALQFDGTASRVIVANSESLALGPDATFAFWINPATYGTEQSAGTYNFNEGRILRKGTHFDVFVVDNPGGVRQTLIAGGVNPPQGSVELGQWQHFAVVFKAGMAQFYKNGFPLGDLKAAQFGATNAEPVVLGNFDADIVTPRFFQGAMDDVAVWGRPLSDVEILEVAGRDVSGPPIVAVQPLPAKKLEGASVTFSVMATGKRPVTYQWYRNANAIADATANQLTLASVTPGDAGPYTVKVKNELGEATSQAAELVVESLGAITSGLVAYWNFDETQGTTLQDRSGHGNNGTLQNFTAVPGIAGQVGGAFDLDGVDDFIVVPHNDLLNLADQATISVWINPHSYSVVGGYGRIARKSVNYDFTVYEANHAVRLFGINKTPYDAPANTLDLDTWQHFAMTIRNGSIQFYKNGKPAGAAVAGLLGESNKDPLIIGNFQADLNINRIYNGLMDDLGIWARALTASDIDGIYQNGVAGKPLTTGLESLTIKRVETATAGKLDVVFSSPYTDRQYSVQWKPALSAASWSDVANVQFSAAGQGLMKASFNRPTDPVAFYRIAASAPATP